MSFVILATLFTSQPQIEATTTTDFATMFGLVYNTKYTGAFIENSPVSLALNWNITDSLIRNVKFYKPP